MNCVLLRVVVLPDSPNNIHFFDKKLKNVSCEYDRLNGWNSTLHAAWYIIQYTFVGRAYSIPGISFIIWFSWTKPTIWVLTLSFTILRRSHTHPQPHIYTCTEFHSCQILSPSVRPMTMETRCAKVIFANYSKKEPAERYARTSRRYGEHEKKNICICSRCCTRRNLRFDVENCQHAHQKQLTRR